MKVINTFKHRTDGVTELSITKKDGSVHICLIDTADFEEISKHNWTVSVKGYVIRFHRVAGKGTTVYLHRHLIGEIPDGKYVDHINTNRSDNRRRSNLRVVTNSENQQNQRLRENKSIPVKGLTFQNNRCDVRAYINKNGVRHNNYWSIKDHGEERAIALATQWITTKREQLHGEYARHA